MTPMTQTTFTLTEYGVSMPLTLMPKGTGKLYLDMNPDSSTMIDRTQRIYNNKYKFSRAKWYVADIIGTMDYRTFMEMRRWIRDQFGPQDRNPNAWSRWYSDGFVIKFRDEADFILFALRWS